MIRSLIRKKLGEHLLEFNFPNELRNRWPVVEKLDFKHLKNCRVLPSRDVMLDFMPIDSVCAEIGIFRCAYTDKILERTQPKKLHLFDIDAEAMSIARQKFAGQIRDERVVLHEGDSSSLMASLPDEYFDWVYIDGDHSYEGVKKDILSIQPKMKPSGLLAFNDYTYFNPIVMKKFGVVEAINEFCIKEDYELVFMALHGRGFNDVVIRKIEATVPSTAQDLLEATAELVP